MPHLEWMTRNEDLQAAARVPYRLLEEVPELSYTGKDPATENMLIQGDNLEALKSLLPFYAGQVKCIFIDPPYNTRSAFEHYDDNLEHTQWLAMMVPRLELLRQFLREDGSIWVTIDDNEAHYLKVLMDEIFGRNNFVANIVWQKKYAVANDHKTIAPMHDHLLVYSLSSSWKRNLVARTVEKDRQYRTTDEKGLFRVSDYTCNKSMEERPNLYYAISNPNTGEQIWPKKVAVWRYSQERHAENVVADLVYWGKDGRGHLPAYKRYLNSLLNTGVVPQTLWTHQYAGHTDEARKEARLVLDSKSLTTDFITPKPERLLARVLETATFNGDLVLDSFLGSGTTAAVAAKMGRRYIGIEMGDHAVTHCAPRLRKVVDGEQGGISESVGWQGGGGFRFYRLGKTIFDEAGQLDPGIRFTSLAAHVWFSETRTPWLSSPQTPAPSSAEAKPSPFLGVHGETAFYLLYNGVLGDKRPDGGNVITRKVLAALPGFREHTGPKVIYGESSRLGAAALKAAGIVFKQTPYDVRAR